MSTVLEPEAELLWAVLRDAALAKKLARAPGGWRTLTRYELDELELDHEAQSAVLALQQLVKTGYPPLPIDPLLSPQRVAAHYQARLGGLTTEVLLALGLDGRHRLRGEVELARGGSHAAVLTPADVLRPLVKMGATGFLLVHNHPSGDPTPSEQDLEMTAGLEAAALIVGIPLLDHLVIGARGGGYTSLFERGVLTPRSTTSTAVNSLRG